MNTDILSDVARLSDQELLVQIPILAGREREATAALIAHLSVFDERRLYLGEGCSSMFGYCTQVLYLSEYAAYNRIEAARAARKYPVILTLLAEGSLNLATVRLLAPELTPANHRELLEAAKHRSKREVEELVARLRPRPCVPSVIRRLPASDNAPAPAATTDAGLADTAQHGARGSPPVGDGRALSLSDAAGFNDIAPPDGLGFDLHGSGSPVPLSSATASAIPSTARPAIIVPLTPERYKVQFTASAETHAKLRQAQDLLRHQIPDGDLGQIIDRALTLLLKDVAKQKVAAMDRPGGNGTHDRNSGQESRNAAPGSRHIPAEVKRAVWLRDGGRCAFVARNGRRCTGRGFLEFHHIMPYAAGGAATVDNIELRCRAHNHYEAELYFGPSVVPSGHRTVAAREIPVTCCDSPDMPSGRTRGP